MQEDSWMTRSKCATEHIPPSFFNPGSDLIDYEAAKKEIEKIERERAIRCSNGIPCEVKALCLEYALENDLTGVWGGTSTQNRVGIKRARRRIKISA